MLFSLLKLIFEAYTFILSFKNLNVIHVLYLLVLHNSLVHLGEGAPEPTIQKCLASVGDVVPFSAFLFED